MMEKRKLKRSLREYLSGKPSPEGKALFEQWYNSFPDAASPLDGLSPKEQEALEAKMLHRIEDRLVGRAPQRVLPQKGIPPVRPLWASPPLRVASAVAALILCAVLGYRLISEPATAVTTTGYGQLQRLSLPDGSQVTLNANSRLKYGTRWDKDHPREVWLEGEAFFSVAKRKEADRPGAKFIVHTADLDVQVLGTQFSVHRRKAQTRVVLNEGKIRLSVREQPSAASILMKPGEMVRLSSGTDRLVRQQVNPEVYSSWTDSRWVMEDTPLMEVVSRMEEIWGRKVVVSDTALVRVKLTGSFPAESPAALLKAIAATLEVSVDSTGTQLRIAPL